MHYVKLGNGSNIVFLHGWGCSGEIFLAVAKHLGNYACYLPDFRGFGKSLPPSSNGWTVEDFAKELFAFFAIHGIRNATIVAHSFGCRVAMVFATLHPELVQKLLLVSPAGVRRFSVARCIRVWHFKLHKFLCKNETDCAVERFGSADYKACNEILRKTFVKVVNQNLVPFAKKIEKETLILCGTRDTATPLSHARTLNRCIKNSCLMQLDGDHFVVFQNPGAFAKIIEYFAES